jgi:tetratricopeptide (TPR) repeat protein
MASINEDDHWRLLAEVTPHARADRAAGAALLDAYGRTAEAMAASAILAVGRGLLMEAYGDGDAAEVLAKTAGDRSASPLARAIGSVVLARLLGPGGPASERGAALRTALKLLADPAVAGQPVWLGLNGTVPRFEDLSLELGELLLEGHDPAGAAEVLKAAHDQVPHHDQVCTHLADAYFRTGQLGAALTVLDGLVAYYRGSGQLEPMAGVLRRMSQLAPNNIKVKARLIDTYLQRGFVAEARTELIQRAELEERSGLIKDAVTSLQRAADLSWNVGMADETFALYQRAIGLVPDQVDYRHALVALYLQAGRLAEAAEHQRAIVDISLQAGRKHEAIAALHQVIGLTPDDTSAYYQLGELLSSAGEYGQAERVYRRILAITPDDAIAQAKANSMAALHERRTA